MFTDERFLFFSSLKNNVIYLFQTGNKSNTNTLVVACDTFVENSSMTNINDSKLLHCGEEQKDAKRVKNFIIITSVDDGNDQVLSGLNSSNVETFFANLNHTGLIDKHQMNNLMNNSNKRLLSQYV